MNRRLSLFLLFNSILNFYIADAQWIKEKCPTTNNLNAISSVSGNVCWVVGDQGTVLCKKEREWIVYNKPTVENLYGIYMIDTDNGWAVGARGTIVCFDGKTWKPFESPTNKNLLSVYFKDSENGIAVGEFGTIIIYKDGIWNIMANGSRGNFNTAFFENDNVWIGGGLECVNVPIVKMAYNHGMTLSNKFESFFASINGISFLNSYNGWAVGSPSVLVHFNGLEWERPKINYQFPSLNSVYFLGENNGISVGYGGTILIFSEGNWIKENSHVTQDLKGAAIVDKAYYVVGNNGTILKKDLPQKDSKTAISEQIPSTINLYPNPCNEWLNIVRPIEGGNLIDQVSIINAQGQMIFQKNYNQEKARLPYHINTSTFGNGFYMLKINIDGKAAINKFIVQH